MRKKNKKLKKANKGITLIALVVTIVVLLILAGVSISMLGGENGIITQAIEAKDENEKAEEKEKVQLAATAAKGKTNWGEITEENLAEELTKNIGERDTDYTLTKDGDKFIVTYTDSNRSYEIDANGNVTGPTNSDDNPGGGTGDSNLPVETPEVSTDPAFTRANGVIEIEFLDGTSYNTTTTPNEPKMTSDMKKVYWEEDGTEVVEGSADFVESEWYSYTAQSGATTSGGISKWANAKTTSDGSYWVWIPRYAYRIVYFDTADHAETYRTDSTQTEGIVGYSDARGIVDKDGKTPSDIGTPVTSIAVGTNKLRPHPAFEDGSKTGYTQGEWDSKLEGIWVAKYEMSMEKDGVATNTSTSTIGNVLTSDTIKAVSKPGVTSWRNIKIGNMYTNGYNYDREKDSHLMKNSEWGAVAYLTESKYGRNGTAVSKNTNTSYYTAGASGATATTKPLQSTTGNEYGIYDTVGGVYEYVAGYIADSSRNYGNSFASTDNTTNNKTESTKYATVYQMASSNDLQINYNINVNKIFGDATTETSTSGSGRTSWHSASSYFVGINSGSYDYSFFYRGGLFSTFNLAGPFSFGSYGGIVGSSGDDSDAFRSFRVCFAVK